MDPELKKRLDIRMRNIDEENKRMEKIFNNFAKEIFKKHPGLMGITITGITGARDKNGHGRVNGKYIENKSIKEKRYNE